LLRLLDGVVQRRVARRVSAARAGGDLDVLDQLGEQLAALSVDHRLLVLGGGPLGVAAHVLSFTMSTNSSWIRRSGVSSGWKAVASSGPCRTATILPVRSSVPRMATFSPFCSTQGARIKTACSGAAGSAPGSPVSVMSVSKESTC